LEPFPEIRSKDCAAVAARSGSIDLERTIDTVCGSKTAIRHARSNRKLLILQDRDRKIVKVKEELAHIPAERHQLERSLPAPRLNWKPRKRRVKQIESERKKLELDVDAKNSRSKDIPSSSFKRRKTRNTAP